MNTPGTDSLLDGIADQPDLMTFLQAETEVTLVLRKMNTLPKPMAESLLYEGKPVTKEKLDQVMDVLVATVEHNPVVETTLNELETTLFGDALEGLEEPEEDQMEPEAFALPDLLKERGKLDEYRRLGKLRDYLEVDMEEMKKIQTEMSEHKWSPAEPSLKQAGVNLRELSKSLAAFPPQDGPQKVGMMNAQLSLHDIAEALKKADTVLAGVAEHRKSGGVAELSEGPEAVRRELLQALDRSRFLYLWQAVELPENVKTWEEQALLHKGMDKAYTDMKADCKKVVRALEKTRDAYLKDVRSELKGLQEEEVALSELAKDTDGADPMSAKIRDAARALIPVCVELGNALSEAAATNDDTTLKDLKKATADLRNMSAALCNAAIISGVADAAEKTKVGDPLRALAKKALDTVATEVEKARDKLEGRLKPGFFTRKEKHLSRHSHTTFAEALKKADGMVKIVKQAMGKSSNALKQEEKVEEGAAHVLLHVLRHESMLKKAGKQWDKAKDMASALGHLTVKGWRATQTGMAHGLNPAQHSDFHSQIRGVVSSPLGMMLNVHRAMEDLAEASMAASEKKPQVKRQLRDSGSILTPDQRKETLHQYQEAKLAELDKKWVEAEQQIETLGRVMEMTERELGDMQKTFLMRQHQNSIGVIRTLCRASAKRCRDAMAEMSREMKQLVNPGGNSGIPASALRGKKDYKQAQRAIMKCLRTTDAAMKKLSTEVAEITQKQINLFSKDAKLVKYIAGVLHASKAQIPEAASAEGRAHLLSLFDRVVDELGDVFKTDKDLKGKAFIDRVRREGVLLEMKANLAAETPEKAAAHLEGWVQKMTKKSSGAVSGEFAKRMVQTLFGQTAKSLLGGVFHGAKILSFGYRIGKEIDRFVADRARLDSAYTPTQFVRAADLDAVENRLVYGILEQTVSLFTPSVVKTTVKSGFLVQKIRQDGFRKVLKDTSGGLPGDVGIELGFQGMVATGVAGVNELHKAAETRAAQSAASAEGKSGEAERIPVGNSRPAEANRIAEQQRKSGVAREKTQEERRVKRSAPAAAVAEAEDDALVGSSQNSPVDSTDDIEFTMTEEEFNDTQIGIDVRNSTKIRTFIEKDIQDVIDRHPGGNGKVTSPYSWVDTVNTGTNPYTFERKRVIDIYTGNGVTDDVKILWEGSTGRRDSTDTSDEFRKDLFGHKPYKFNKDKPFEITRLTPDDISKSQRSYTRLRQAWTNHMTEMRKRMPELATLYRNVFKLGFTNALNSSGNDLSETEKTTIRGYLNGNTSGVITLRYNGEKVPDVIALVIPGTSENKTHILMMDYDGNFKRVEATRTLGEVENNSPRYSFEPDEETQQFISRRLVVGDREKASAQKKPKVIMDPSSNYDTKLADRYLNAQDREFKRVVADSDVEMLDIKYKAIDDVASNLGMVVGMTGLPKSTPMGMFASALITTGKGFAKYIITPEHETKRLNNIRNQTIRDVFTGGFSDLTIGKTMDNLPQDFNELSKKGMEWYQKSTSWSGDMGKVVNQFADQAYDWMGLTIEDTTRPDTSFSNAERTSAPSEDALTSSSRTGGERSRTEMLWGQTANDLNKGFDELRYNKLSANTLKNLDELGIDYKKILNKHGTPASIKNATTNGVTDYSQVVYDKHGVNELWGKASKAYKKWLQSERLERMSDKLEVLESKVTGDQTILIPYSLLKDFRDAGFDIDGHMAGNAIDDDNNPETKYTKRPEQGRLNHTELKRLRFIAKAKQLEPSDINGVLKLLDEMRNSLSGDERTTIPHELQEILEKHGIKVKDYIRVHGDIRPARKAALQKGHQYPEQHLWLSDRTMDKSHFGDLAAMARLKLLERNVQVLKDDVESLINGGTPGRLNPATIKSLRDNGINIDALAHNYGTPSSKEAAMSDAGELNIEEVDIDVAGARLLKIKIEQRIRQYKIKIMIERMKTLKELPDGGYRLPHDIIDFIKKGQATREGELYLEYVRHNDISDSQLKSLRWMLEAEVELSPESTHEELAAFVHKMESDTTSGDSVTLPPSLIHFLRARGVSVDKYLRENGDTIVAISRAKKRSDENQLNMAEINVNKGQLKEIEDMIIAQKRKTEASGMIKRLNDLRTSMNPTSEVDLPEDIRKFVLASPEVDDNNRYLEELKWRTVTKAELDWLYWTLKAEAELGTDSTPEQTIAFMRKMEISMVGDEVRAFPPRLINRLKSHGIAVDDYLNQFGDTGLAKNLALLRGNENILDSRDIKLSKPRLTKLREMLAAMPAVQQETTTPVSAAT
ncbi:hypothetical protein [Pantoea sp.]|uniref:hypothetical protein n=1 Tax=Pantoea sp. TaxID=69393 RepID=UPI0028A675C2|nr:hypothetical protein [Pantoea sp.]